jgi:protein-tyrosine phosphatase
VTLPPPLGPTYRITMVCSGNICRSPIAEVVLRRLAGQAGLGDRVVVESAGMGSWHVDEPADPRAVTVLHEHGYDGSDHRAQGFDPAWFADRDLVVAMDQGHRRGLRALAPGPEARDRVRLLRSFDPWAPPDAEVADPYFGDARDFATVLEQVEAACGGLLAEIEAVLGGG